MAQIFLIWKLKEYTNDHGLNVPILPVEDKHKRNKAKTMSIEPKPFENVDYRVNYNKFDPLRLCFRKFNFKRYELNLIL